LKSDIFALSCEQLAIGLPPAFSDQPQDGLQQSQKREAHPSLPLVMGWTGTVPPLEVLDDELPPLAPAPPPGEAEELPPEPAPPLLDLEELLLPPAAPPPPPQGGLSHLQFP
jgi:hypothetical protein